MGSKARRWENSTPKRSPLRQLVNGRPWSPQRATKSLCSPLGSKNESRANSPWFGRGSGTDESDF